MIDTKGKNRDGRWEVIGHLLWQLQPSPCGCACAGSWRCPPDPPRSGGRQNCSAKTPSRRLPRLALHLVPCLRARKQPLEWALPYELLLTATQPLGSGGCRFECKIFTLARTALSITEPELNSFRLKLSATSAAIKIGRQPGYTSAEQLVQLEEWRTSILVFIILLLITFILSCSCNSCKRQCCASRDAFLSIKCTKQMRSLAALTKIQHPHPPSYLLV